MKEATGELNLTVVIVATVGLLSVFFFSMVWPKIKENFAKSAKCSMAICEPCNTGHDCKQVKCYVKGKKSITFYCPYKG